MMVFVWTTLESNGQVNRLERHEKFKMAVIILASATIANSKINQHAKGFPDL